MFGTFISWYKDISFIDSMSKSKDEAFNKRIFQQDCSLYGESKSYRIQYDHKKVTLVPNHRYLDPKKPAPKTIHPGTNKYIFVIVMDQAMKPQLRIGLGGHYFLAHEKNKVIAAGDINFIDNQIDKITDYSGGFHVNFKNSTDVAPLSQEEKECYRYSFIFALKQVGLPVNKFEPFVELESSSIPASPVQKKLR